MTSNIASRLKLYEYSFLPSTLNAWNKLPDHVKSCTTVNQFKNELAKYLASLNVPSKVPQSHQRSVFQFSFYCTGYYGKILNQIRYGLSPLNMQLFTYNINDNPFCPECHDIVEDSTHFFNVLNMFSFVQKCLNHLGPYYEIRVYMLILITMLLPCH